MPLPLRFTQLVILNAAYLTKGGFGKKEEVIIKIYKMLVFRFETELRVRVRGYNIYIHFL